MISYVRGAERMITAARLEADGVYVRFADEREGLVPFPALDLTSPPRRVTVPRLHLIEVRLQDGGTEEIPWDFARHYCDEDYRAGSEKAAARGREELASRLRARRSDRGLTQKELARAAGISRVSIARIETGEQLPRFQTLMALADALEVPLERLVAETSAETKSTS